MEQYKQEIKQKRELPMLGRSFITFFIYLKKNFSSLSAHADIGIICW